MDLQEIAARLGTALLLGAVIGFERQWRQRMAGLRTNALVAIGAAGFVVFSTTVSGDNSPTRVAAQIVSGIGFLGAGVSFARASMCAVSTPRRHFGARLWWGHSPAPAN
jgi:putative Mg2+ transporter-C (MgtC) family protein